MTGDDRIRPGIKIAAALAVIAAVVVVWLVFAGSPFSGPGEADGERAEGPEGWDPDRFVGDDGWHDGWQRSDGWGAGADWTRGPWPEAPPDDDPQIQASARFFPDGGSAMPFRPFRRLGRVTTVDGELPVGVGDRCEVRVLPARTRRFNCLVRVACGEHVIYPDGAQQAGYVPCDLQDGVPSRAVDDGFTHQDGDPTIELDGPGRRLVVTDARPGGPSFVATFELAPGSRPMSI